ncbi:MAG TPA: type IV secretory system conjugative DNA transfer family protein [Ktedonobacterales bacterium]|nr:type IV secretory system conjugative DNA transfer family protein [Ktedonobacterales bacterium]
MMLTQPLHRARYASREEVWPLASPTLPTDGMLLGTKRLLLRKRLITVQKTAQRPELGNLLIVAPTRSGKGLLAVSQLLTWHHSVIVNDIKGDLFSQTAGFRSLLGPVYVLDPRGVGHCYDPLAGKTTEDALLSSAGQLLQGTEKDIFTDRAIKMLAAIFAAAKREGIAALPYARMVTHLGFHGCTKHLQTVDPALATAFLDASPDSANLDDRFLLSAYSTMTTKLEPLTTEIAIRSLGQSEVTPEQIITSDKPVTVYLRWRERDLGILEPLVRLLWGSLIDEMVSIYDSRAGQGCHPVMLLVDEAGRTAIPSLAEHVTTVVGRGISLWLSVQSLSQLENVYGRTRAHVLRDNMESQLYYRPNDLATAQYIEDRIGRRSAYARSATEQQGGKTSEGQSEQGIPLLTAQDFMMYKDHEVIGFHRALPPFTLHRMDWRDHPILQKRRSAPAPALPTLAAIGDLPTQQHQRRSHYIDPNAYLKT